MAKATRTASFPFEAETVWNIVTSLEHYSWRSDLSRIDVIDDTNFVEYTKDGYATSFTVTCKEPCKRWEFDIENSNMHGHWTGLFSQNAAGETTVDFTEEVTAKKIFMKPLVGIYLRKQQKTYMQDLKKALDSLA